MAPRATGRSRFGLLSPALILRRKALRQGVFGGQRLWQLIAVVIFGRRLLRKVMGKEPQLIAMETLKAGQSMTITALPAARRSGRR